MGSKQLKIVSSVVLALSLLCASPMRALAQEDAASDEAVAVEQQATDVAAPDTVMTIPEIDVSDEGLQQGADASSDECADEPTSAVASEYEAPQIDSPSDVLSEDDVLNEGTAVEEVDGITTDADADTTSDEVFDEAEMDAQDIDPEAQAALDAFAAEHAGDLPAGRYAIYTNAPAASSNNADVTYSFDIKGNSTKNGAAVIVYAASTQNNQRWDIDYLASGYATIRSVSSGLYLSLANGEDAYEVAGSAKLVQWAVQSGATWQQWVIAKLPDGSYTITSALLNGSERRLLDVQGGKADNGKSVILYKDTSKNGTYAANQKWNIVVTEDILDKEAKAHKDDLPAGTYLLASAKNASLVLNVRYASLENGGSIILYANEPTVNEGWTVSYDASGYATITNALSGLVLDVKGGKAKEGVAVAQWAPKNPVARNQKWVVSLQADGSYKITSALAGGVRFILSAASGSVKSGSGLVLRADKAGDKSRLWTVEQAPEQYEFAHAIANGTYLIRTSLDITKVLDVSRNSKDEGAQVKIWQCKLTNNQLWELTRDKQGYALLKNKNSGLYLTFSTKAVDGSIIAVQSKTPGRWVIEPSGETGFVMRGYKTGRCLDLSRNATANGSKVIAYKATGGKNQTWAIAAPVKIAIDPGHGGNDSGAVGNGMRECDLTWNIAQACISELKAYGFDVYLTINENEFRNGATVSIADRVQRAYNAGCASIFSMHINAGGGSGAVVLVPNSSSYHHEFYTMGQSFAKNLMSKFGSIGIGTWDDGAWERNYSVAEGADQNQYYEGKVSNGIEDYYGIVRYARRLGMFGVIIEHGFIDNAHDASILRQAAAQRTLGKADAACIKALYV